jgi:pyridoxal 5'-phosphate synthase pdxT subunit
MQHILLSCAGVKQGGQALLGGLDCLVARNFFGAQINSFETRMPAPPCLQQYAGNGSPAEPYRAVFIRSARHSHL